MRSAVISSPRQAALRVTEAPPPIAPDQLRVRVQGCGVCGSNVPVWEGRPWFHYPLEAGAPGHEGWGIVDEVGVQVKGFHRGDRIAFLSSHAYADYDVTSESQTAPLPADVEAIPFPAEPLACAMNAFERSRIRSGESVAIIGVGFLGALLTKLSRNAGAHVAAISRRDFALEIGEQFGAQQVWRFGDPNVRQSALAWADNGGFDCVIEAAGLQE